MKRATPDPRPTMTPPPPQERVSTPPGVEAQPLPAIESERPALPDREAPSDALRDPWRDRLRVAFDRGIYAAALFVIYKLALVHLLDVGTGTLVLLVAGIRPHNLFDFASMAKANGGRAALALLAAPAAEALRNGSWLAR